MESFPVRQLEADCRNVGIDPKATPMVPCGGMDAYKLKLRIQLLEKGLEAMTAEKDRWETECMNKQILSDSWCQTHAETKNSLILTERKLKKLEETVKQQEVELAALRPAPVPAVASAPAAPQQPGQNEVVKAEVVAVPEVEGLDDEEEEVDTTEANGGTAAAATSSIAINPEQPQTQQASGSGTLQAVAPPPAPVPPAVPGPSGTQTGKSSSRPLKRKATAAQKDGERTVKKKKQFGSASYAQVAATVSSEMSASEQPQPQQASGTSQDSPPPAAAPVNPANSGPGTSATAAEQSSTRPSRKAPPPPQWTKVKEDQVTAKKGMNEAVRLVMPSQSRPATSVVNSLVAQVVAAKSCQFCNLKFVTTRLRDNHVRRDHRDGVKWNCSVSGCDQEYYSSTGLKNHFFADHLEQRISCPRCQRPFRGKEHLTRHLKRCPVVELQ